MERPLVVFVNVTVPWPSPGTNPPTCAVSVQPVTVEPSTLRTAETLVAVAAGRMSNSRVSLHAPKESVLAVAAVTR